MTPDQKVEKCRKRGHHQWRLCGRTGNKRVSMCESCGKPLTEVAEDRVARQFI